MSGTSTDFDFVITENSNHDGSRPIAWKVLASFDDLLDGSDIPIASGTIAALHFVYRGKAVVYPGLK